MLFVQNFIAIDQDIRYKKGHRTQTRKSESTLTDGDYVLE